MADHELILSLGGNLGNKAEIFTETRKYVCDLIGIIKDTSPVYETQPWGFESLHSFWNQVLVVETGLSPAGVLAIIRKIEDHFGRTRETGKYLSRMMDIDILFYGSQIVHTGELVIPHPLIAYRRFILAPLADIMPLFEHPVTGKRVIEMLGECSDSSEVKRIENIL